LHFFWLCVAFGAFTFSFNGPFDRLDWTFYWGDAMAMRSCHRSCCIHARLPRRPPWHLAPLAVLLPVMYLPAVILGAARIVAIAKGATDGAFLSRA
jgi:hypothetical protein